MLRPSWLRNTTTEREFNMSWFFLMLQGGLMGYVAGQAFPGWGWEFFAVLLANSVLTASYGTARKLED